ncbi:hypothetical protein FXE63_00165 [Vibrio mimicus]|uniref:hypothetical protein n=1 Tax=Vibrio mimicus TaxID=674 RepID=UPI0011D499DA|nr:hypothetical protein [Vibrio mimicus]TXZ09568.1 hypothetical protein FXE63_00165 [Vibrio mimicus]
MKFEDLYVSREDRYSIGQELESKRFYISIPVSNGLIDYEEYYEIDKKLADLYPDSKAEIIDIVVKCRERKNDENLIIKPGKNRGVAT